MKAKFLLPTLVGLSLVACTAEDDFSQSAEMKQSPITFTVEKDGAELDTRATLGGNSGTAVSFSMGDLISLYHGTSLTDHAFTEGDITAGQNAIFEGEGLDGELVFKTKSMVLEGGAVMVYPADTSFVNKAGGVISISVPAEQDGKTKYFQPYMSEAFEIGQYVGNKDAESNKNTAGYGRNYTVPLKKVGSLLQMTLNAQNINMINDIQGVDDVVIKSVEINGAANTFATTVKVTATDEIPVLVTNEAAAEVKKYAHLKNQTGVVTTSSAASISTTDIANNVAYFTLLPQVAAPTTGEEVDPVAEETETYTPATSIVVYTTYGKVTVDSKKYAAADATTYPLINTNAEAHQNLDGAINAIVTGAWGENKMANSSFKGEMTGASFKRTFTFDMKGLDMNGTEVETSKQLIDLLKVYNALGLKDKAEGNVTWKLKGANNNFLMSGDALSKLIEVNTAGKITLNINANTITLNDANATLAKLQNENVKFDENPHVILAANLDWTVDQKLSVNNISTLTNKGNLTVTNNTANYTTALAVELVNAGTITTGSDKVTLGTFTANVGSTINMAAGKTLYFAGLTNLYGTITNEGIISANKGIVNNFGTIDNKFEVSVVEKSGGAFNNGGIIKNNGDLAVTYLTSNNAIIATKTWKGIIELTNRNDQVSIDATGEKGFIKYTLKETEANYVPAKGDKFNWLVINKTGNVSLENKSEDEEFNETVDYLELNGNPVNITANEFTTIVLFVEQSMRLLDGNSLNASYIYVKDYILRAAGTLTGSKVESYTPTTYPGVTEAIPYNGEIRTAK